MGMPLYLVVGDRCIPTDNYYDNLQDTKTDYPWNVFDVYAKNGCLYASVKHAGRTHEIRTPNGRAFY